MASDFDEIRLVTKLLNTDNSVNWCAFKVHLKMTFTCEFLNLNGNLDLVRRTLSKV